MKSRAKRGEPLRFIKAALASNTSDCILWPFGSGGGGYGKLWADGKRIDSHAYVCQKYHGFPDKKSDARHLCGVKLCVNPKHLEWGSRSQNMLDMAKHGTMVCGEKSPKSKVTKDQVIAILSSKETAKNIAVALNISDSQVGRIRRREQWRWICEDTEIQKD